MNRDQRIKSNIETIKTYVSEHGQEYGTVSWRMADLAINMLDEDINELQNYLELIKSERLEK